jgi:hypothetical protein
MHEARGPGKGVFRGIAAGCAAALVLLAAGAVTAYVKRAAVMRWATVRVADKMSQRLMLDLPAGIDPARARRTLDRLAQGIEQGTVDRQGLGAVYRSMDRALADGKLEKAEAEELLREIDAVHR